MKENELLAPYMDIINEVQEMCREIDEALHEADPENITRWNLGRAREIHRRMLKVMKYIEETRTM